MKLHSLLAVGFSAAMLLGCQPSAIGESETNRAFPEQSQAELEAALAKEGKLEEYKEAQERDRAYREQGAQSTGEQGSTSQNETAPQ